MEAAFANLDSAVDEANRKLDQVKTSNQITICFLVYTSFRIHEILL